MDHGSNDEQMSVTGPDARPCANSSKRLRSKLQPKRSALGVFSSPLKNALPEMDHSLLIFIHSILRYLVLISVGYAGITHLVGLLRGAPILNGERTAAIIALALCHLQLVLGLSLYLLRISLYSDMAQPFQRFWKYEHIGTMVTAIVLVTLGRILSRRAEQERGKQIRVAAFYLIALVLMLWATPWPFTTIGHGRAWM